MARQRQHNTVGGSRQQECRNSWRLCREEGTSLVLTGQAPRKGLLLLQKAALRQLWVVVQQPEQAHGWQAVQAFLQAAHLLLRTCCCSASAGFPRRFTCKLFARSSVEIESEHADSEW